MHLFWASARSRPGLRHGPRPGRRSSARSPVRSRPGLRPSLRSGLRPGPVNGPVTGHRQKKNILELRNAHTGTLAWAGEDPFRLGQIHIHCPGSCATRAAIALLGKWRRRFLPRGSLTSLRSAVQSKKALLAMYLNEGGIASSGSAAQFMKALTRMVWRVGGRQTSLRLVQCTKVNWGFLLSLYWRGQLSLVTDSCHRHAPLILRSPA